MRPGQVMRTKALATEYSTALHRYFLEQAMLDAQLRIV
jgi:hypothetical protein